MGHIEWGTPMTDERKLDLPSPWEDWNLKDLQDWPEDVSHRPDLVDESFKNLNSIFQGLGLQLFENIVGRSDVHMCNICGIMFFPDNPETKCPLCALVHWLVGREAPMKKLILTP